MSDLLEARAFQCARNRFSGDTVPRRRPVSIVPQEDGSPLGRFLAQHGREVKVLNVGCDIPTDLMQSIWQSVDMPVFDLFRARDDLREVVIDAIFLRSKHDYESHAVLTTQLVDL